MLHEHYLDLLDDIAALVAELDAHSDPVVGEKVATLLQRVDLMHREGLVRLIEALRADGARETVERAIERDEIVRILLGLYGLADLGLPAETVAADDGEAPAKAQVGFFPIERLTVRRAAAP